MSVTEEELMAYVDGELDPSRLGAVEAAISADPELRRRTIAQRHLRDRLRGCFDRTLDEPVPAALLAAAQGSAAGPAAHWSARPRPGLRAAPWLAAAASFVLGLIAGPWYLSLTRDRPHLATAGSRLMARGDLAHTLSTVLGAAQSPAAAEVRVGLSFVSQSGHYCRTFIDATGHDSLAGIACRDRDGWHVTALQSGGDDSTSPGDYRQAATPLPPLVLEAVTAQMRGEPLDAAAEATARARNWAPPAP